MPATGTSATTAISSRGDMVSSQDTMMSSSCSRPVTSSQQGTEPVLPASPALSPIRTVVTCATDIEMENSSNSDMSDLELLNSSSLECTTTPKSICKRSHMSVCLSVCLSVSLYVCQPVNGKLGVWSALALVCASVWHGI